MSYYNGEYSENDPYEYNEDEYEDYEDDEVYDDPVVFMKQDFSEQFITDILSEAGLLADETIWYSGNMGKLVFSLGNDSEVYSRQEIKFIEQLDQVIVYEDFTKRLRQGKMVCRVVAAKIDNSGIDAVRECISFEKIIDKALDGFNIFVLVTDDSVFFGSRLFDQSENSDCLLSRPIQTETQYEQLMDEMIYDFDTDNFTEFYINFTCSITLDIGSSLQDYDASSQSQRKIRPSYMDAKDHLQKYKEMDYSPKRRGHRKISGEIPEMTFSDLLADVEESLSFIKSRRINSYEMLFEADKMLREASEAEAENERLLHTNPNIENKQDKTLDDQAKALLEDPEELIKLLKKRKGL